MRWKNHSPAEKLCKRKYFYNKSNFYRNFLFASFLSLAYCFLAPVDAAFEGDDNGHLDIYRCIRTICGYWVHPGCCDSMETLMKYEETLKRLQKETQEQDWFKPLKLTYPTESPRGQPIEKKHFKVLASNVPIVWSDQL
jgi:hypothetical protein